MLNVIGIEEKIVNILKYMYDNTICCVMIDGKLTEWFQVMVMFNVFLEFVMDDVKSLNEFHSHPDMSTDFRYVDTTLIAMIFEKLNLVTLKLDCSCKKWGRKINTAKCKVLSPCGDPVTIDNNPMGYVENFVFLGSSVSNLSDEIKRRIGMVSSAFWKIEHIDLEKTRAIK